MSVTECNTERRCDGKEVGNDGTGVASATQCHLLRDLIGNPFRPARVDPAWLTQDVRHLAQVIYEERRFEDVPFLADALLDAGCDDEAMLAHCSAREQNGRGCWVVDLLLGKE